MGLFVNSVSDGSQRHIHSPAEVCTQRKGEGNEINVTGALNFCSALFLKEKIPRIGFGTSGISFESFFTQNKGF